MNVPRRCFLAASLALTAQAAPLRPFTSYLRRTTDERASTLVGRLAYLVSQALLALHRRFPTAHHHCEPRLRTRSKLSVLLLIARTAHVELGVHSL